MSDRAPIAFFLGLLITALPCFTTGTALAEGPTFAGTRPANPTMDYVPQNFGIYDTYYEFFTEADCRSCHGATTAKRHHATTQAANGLCLDCHCDDPYVVPPVRDCLVCHTDSAQFCGGGAPQGGHYGSPHHRTDFSEARECTACHSPNIIVETGTVDPPNYDPSGITPTPHDCENCHWPTNCAEVLPERLDLLGATYDQGRVVTNIAGTVCTDNASLFETDWSGWPYLNTAAVPGNGFPRPSIIFDGVGNVPAPIMAPGYMQYGTLGDGKAFLSQTGTHHEVGRGTVLYGNVYENCVTCHASGPYDPIGTNPYLPQYAYYIRYCEKCHDIATLHNITEHVTDGPSTNRALNGIPLPIDQIYTVGGVLGQPVNTNTKCFGCHMDVLATIPDPHPVHPDLWSLRPSSGPGGIVVTIRGRNFGPSSSGGQVLMKREIMPEIFAWESVPVYSWSDDAITFAVPSGSFWPFLPRNSQVRVVTGEGLKSSVKPFVVQRAQPAILGLLPDQGPWTTKVSISGKGFSVAQQDMFLSYGFSTYVELHGFGRKIRATRYVKPVGADTPWTMDAFAVKLDPSSLFDIATGQVVSEEALEPGDWDLFVVTDYFKDDGDWVYFDEATGALDIDQVMVAGTAVPLSQVEPDNLLDGPMGATGDLLLKRARSDAAVFTVTNTPCMNRLKPGGGAYKGEAVRVIGYGFGTEPGQVEVGNKTFGKSKLARIRSWTNTRIRFKMPRLGTTPKTKWVRVHVPGNGTSNAKKIDYLGIAVP